MYYLSNENDEIKKLCSIVIFQVGKICEIHFPGDILITFFGGRSQCARNDTTCNMIRRFGGLDPIVSLMTNEKTRRNKTLLASVTGAVWKCSTNVGNIRRLDELETIPILVQLLGNESEVDVLTHTVGAIAECVKLPHNHVTLLKADGLAPVVNLLNYTDENLLENVCKIVTQCAVNKDCMQQIVQNDGLRLLWSLLRSESCKVQASAAWALVPCIQNTKVRILVILE